jgi:Ion channel
MTRVQADRSQESQFWQTYGRRRYAILFYSLLFILVMTPVAGNSPLAQLAVKVTFGISLLLAVLPNATKRDRVLLIAAVVLLNVVRIVTERDDVPIDFGPVLILYGVAGLLAAGATFRFAVTSRRIDKETIYAALSAYLLAGVFFGVIYSAMEFMSPGSIKGPNTLTMASATYYSFVTLATLGYGDFLPHSALARGVATVEVIGGQLYLAVMVARLIGAFEFNKKT